MQVSSTSRLSLLSCSISACVAQTTHHQFSVDAYWERQVRRADAASFVLAACRPALYSIGLAGYWGEEERNGGIDHTLPSLSFLAYKELTQLPCNAHWLIDIYSVYCLLFSWLHVSRGIKQQLLYFADMTIKFLLYLRSIAYIITTTTKDSVNFRSCNSSRTIIGIYDFTLDQSVK